MALENSLYNIEQTYVYNKEQIPNITPIANLPESPIKANVFGMQLNSPLGVPACPLTMDSERIKFLSQSGFDLITMKSTRSHEFEGNPLPHWLHVNSPGQITTANFNDALEGRVRPYLGQDVSMANSFGIASDDPSIWIAEFNKAKNIILPGQVLILSVLPSTLKSATLMEDIQMLAKQIEQTNAEVIELNLACPNTGGHGLIYQDLELSTLLLKELQRLLPGRKIVAKIGYYTNQSELEQFIFLNQTLAGISTMNTVAMTIVNEKGEPAFGKARPKTGVSGATIRNLALDQATNLVNFRNKLGLEGSLSVIGMGGITKPEDVNLYMNRARVDAVQAAVGTFDRLKLARDYRNLHNQEA